MSNRTIAWNRLGLITTLVEKAPNQTLGRTAIVKLAYLLQTLRGVPLGYDFRLYNYGPFDSDVLDDLAFAQSLDAVNVTTVHYSSGYGYEVRPGAAAEAIKVRASTLLGQHQDAIDWAMREFAAHTASELELISTIVYVNKEQTREGRATAINELTRCVHEVKPHFTEAQIDSTIRSLVSKGIV